MACEVPVVASRVGANIDVVQANCGFLVSGQDEWINALRKMRDHVSSRRKMGSAGRSCVKEKYSLQRSLPVLAELIDNVVSRSTT
ncbi:MAG: hypothetical protein D3924_18255 [Candidatus Electrothrix sp. AR4]|nr:hypothetical protein [Candidatus Electrothrix sp. AR4]